MRDVNKYPVMCRCPLDVAMRIYTVISKRKVPIRNSSGKTRDMGFSDYLVEIATAKVKNVRPSAEARAWGKKILSRNTVKKGEAKTKESSTENKSRHLAFQTRLYFRKRVQRFQGEMDAIKAKAKRNAEGKYMLLHKDFFRMQELKIQLKTAKAGYDKWNEECLKYPDRRRKG